MKKIAIIIAGVLLVAGIAFLAARGHMNTSETPARTDVLAESDLPSTVADQISGGVNVSGKPNNFSSTAPTKSSEKGYDSDKYDDKEITTEQTTDEIVLHEVSIENDASNQEEAIYGLKSYEIKDDMSDNTTTNTGSRKYLAMKNLIEEVKDFEESPFDSESVDIKTDNKQSMEEKHSETIAEESELTDESHSEATTEEAKTDETDPIEKIDEEVYEEETINPSLFEKARNDKELTFDKFNEMDAEQKKALYDSASSPEEFLNWISKIRNEYNTERDKGITNAEEGISF